MPRKNWGADVAKAVQEILAKPLPPGHVPTPPEVDPNDPVSQKIHDLWWEMMHPTPPPPVTITSMAIDALEQELRDEVTEKKTQEPRQ